MYEQLIKAATFYPDVALKLFLLLKLEALIKADLWRIPDIPSYKPSLTEEATKQLPATFQKFPSFQPRSDT